MKRDLIVSLVALPIAIASLSARAAGVSVLIDFDASPLFTPITDQYAHLGVVFDGGLYRDPFPGSSIQGNAEATNFRDSATISNPITAMFASPQHTVEFLAAGSELAGTIQVKTFLGATLLHTGTYSAGGFRRPAGTLDSIDVVVTAAVGLDRVEISRLDGTGAFSIDDFRFTPIPEPHGLAMAMFAMLSAAGGGRLKAKSS